MNKFIKLYNGVQMPIIGYGEYLVHPEICVQSTIDAINSGYTHIDTAISYMNEKEIGEAISKSKIDRKDLFITTKVWIYSMGYENTHKAIYDSLSKLNTNYLDLVLIHQPYGDYYGSWRALEELYEKGVIKAIGVSNFSAERLSDLIWNAKIKPMVNQIEINPLAQRNELVKYCQENDIVVQAWSPLGGEARIKEVINNKKLIKLSKIKNKTIPQIIIRWLIQKNIVPLVKSIKIDRIKENIDVFDFELSNKEMEIINSINKNSLLFDHSTLEGIETLKKILNSKMKR